MGVPLPIIVLVQQQHLGDLPDACLLKLDLPETQLANIVACVAGICGLLGLQYCNDGRLVKV